MTSRRPVRGFLSHAHADAPLVQRLRRLLTPRLQIDRRFEFTVWSDDAIPLADVWDQAIRRAMEEADFAMLLLSPAFLSRDYICKVEIPSLMGSSDVAVMPVGLQRVDFGRSDLQGLDARQIFLLRDGADPEPRWFADLGGENAARFCDELASAIVRRLLGPRS